MLEQLGLLGVRGRDESEEEADDSVSIDGHVQRQEEDEEQVAEYAQAGDRDVAERLGQFACAVLEVVQQEVDLVVEADLAAADGVEAVLPGLEDLAQIAHRTAIG